MLAGGLRKLRFYSDRLPALTILAGCLNGAAALWLSGPGPEYGLVFLCTVPGLLIVWGLLGTERTCRRFLPALFCTLLSVLISSAEYRKSFSGVYLHSGRAMGIEAEVRLTDSSLCGGIPCGISNAPKLISAELLRFRYSPADTWKNTSGNLFLRFAPDNPDNPDGVPEKIGYGDIVRFSGRIQSTENRLQYTFFDFSKYASARNTYLTCRAVKAEIKETGHGFFRSLFDWRSRYLARLNKALSDPEDRALAPALFFGLKQGLDSDTKEEFLKSGTIHIMSVSGLHVGLFFAVLALLFRGVPFRIRPWLVLPPVLLYALSTGMHAPALRSFLMLAAWSVSGACLVRTSGINTILLAACVILCIHPLQLTDIGFQYSFLCVIFLVAGDHFIRGSAEASTVASAFSPERKHSVFNRRGLVSMVGSSLTAWLCGMEISLRTQGLFTPFAVLAYLPMAPAAWLAFAVFAVTIIFCGIPAFFQIAALILHPLLRLISGAAAFFSKAYLRVAPPPLWLVLIFSVILAWVLLEKDSRRRMTGLAAGILLFALSLGWKYWIHPETAVITCGDSLPSVIFTDPASGTAAVVNSSSGEGTEIIRNYLYSRGIFSLTELAFVSPYSAACSNGGELADEFEPDSVQIHGKSKRRNSAEVLKKLPQNMDASGIRSAFVRIEDTADRGFRISVNTPLWRDSAVEIRTESSGVCRISGTDSQGNPFSFRSTRSPDSGFTLIP